MRSNIQHGRSNRLEKKPAHLRSVTNAESSSGFDDNDVVIICELCAKLEELQSR